MENLDDLRVSLQEGRLARGEFLRRALAIDEQSLGPDHLTVALRLNNLSVSLQETNLS